MVLELKPRDDGVILVGQAARLAHPSASLTENLDGLLGQAATVLDERHGLVAQPSAALVGLLASATPERRGMVLEELAERHDATVIDGLAAYLRGEKDSDLVLKAVGALVATGDPRASEALIDCTKGRPSAFLVQVIYALGQTGGETAVAFLTTMAAGHPSAEVRDAAGATLQTLSDGARVKGEHP
jgi:HEAT repeat protein